MAGPVRVQCSSCKQLFDVPSEVIGTDGAHNVIVRMDRSGLFGHMRECLAARPAVGPAEKPDPAEKRAKVSEAELAGRVGLLLDRGDYVASGGSRACTMCGTKGDACLDGLRTPGAMAACCGACGEGNTHPAPGESAGSCAAWAAEHVGRLR